MAGPLFTYGAVALLRAPLHRWDDIVVDPYSYADDEPFPVDALREFLVRPRDPLLDEAIGISSPDLMRSLRRAVEGPRMKPGEVRRAALSLTRYQLRAAGRSTPFALMAGVGRVAFGHSTDTTFGDQHTRIVRPDQRWLIDVVRKLERRTHICARLRVQANNLATFHGDRLVLLPTDADDGALLVERSLRATSAVRLAMQVAAKPTPFKEVLAALEASFPSVPKETTARLLEQLVKLDLLVTELRPPADHPDPLGHVLAIAPEAREWNAVPAMLSAPRRPLRATTASARSDLRSSSRTPLPVTTNVLLDVQGTVNNAVAGELAAAAEVLWRIAPRHSRAAPLADYHDRFVERYGYHRTVSLTELLDPERGIGAPAGYRMPPSELADTSRTVADPGREALLAEAALSALRAGEELVLNDVYVAGLAGSPEEQLAVQPPRGLDIFAELLARDAKAVDGGDFELVLSPWPGGHTPGAAFGRFADFLGGSEFMTEVVAQPRADALPAHFSYSPRLARLRNVAGTHPRWMPHRVIVGAMNGDRPGDIPLDDLCVSADEARLRLYSRSRNAEVDIHIHSMLNPEHLAPNIARFLQEISISGQQPWRPWSWGSLASLPALPRVKYGRVVLAPATWRCVDPQLRDRSLPWADWQKALDRWRAKWSVPDLVKFGDHDQQLRLDLGRRWHRYLLRAEIDAASVDKSITLTEDRARQMQAVWGNTAGWSGSGTLGAEIVVSLKTNPSRQPRSFIYTDLYKVTAPGRLHLPGGSWLYIKLYSNRQQDLLSRHFEKFISSLPAGMKHWFFMRYRDPEPHLRIRFHGEPSLLHGPILSQLHTWAAELIDSGIARRLEMASYEPEYERYGGQDLMPLVHTIFNADSDHAIAVLSRTQQALWRSAVTNSYGIVHDIFSRTPVDPIEWLLRTITKDEERHAIFRSQRNGIMKEIGIHMSAGAEHALPTRNELAETLSQYGERLYAAIGPRVTGTWDQLDGITHSVLHMHHNRLVGINRESELNVLAACRGIAQTHQGNRQSVIR
ncbi:lantibiotic dehydratase [Streptomyces sp. NPDC051664]|uniref:lantibiotic dehydratase n=1 Tax=Streptomyces sp. NPDC051664 TaxID=3365668 RepID=UPI0037AB4274